MKFGKAKRRGYDKCGVQAGTKTEMSEAVTKISQYGKA